MQNITRRNFLKITGSAAGALIIGSRGALALDYLQQVTDPIGLYPPEFRWWEELYRGQYAYDYVSRSTHSMNCTGSCTWKVYVKNGIAYKEEQYSDYPEIDPGKLPADPTKLPTLNPRGCQKGANYIEYVYGGQRLHYPLIRAGNRGEGKWRRATWQEAVSTIVNGYTDPVTGVQKAGIIDSIRNFGPDTMAFAAAIPAKHQITLAGGTRLANLIGGVMCSFYEWYSDLPPGEPQTWGEQTDSCESADWFNSKYILLFGANLLETRIPDAHFFTEGRMRGTKIVAVFPEFNPVSIHADIYVPIKAGTDSALAMGMANVIVNSVPPLYDAPYLTKYTDMPFLVQSNPANPADPNNGKFLRESDMVPGGSPDRLYVWDSAAVPPAPVLVPGTWSHRTVPNDPNWTLNLGTINPALELPAGTQVTTLAGPMVVETVFTKLKQKLALPENQVANVAATTGLDAGLITQIATEFAKAKPAMVIEGAGVNHWYHNDLNDRTLILLVALTGNVGKPGGGFNHYVGQEKIWPEAGWFKLAYPNTDTLTGQTVPPAEVPKPAAVELKRAQRFQNTTLFTFVHADVVSDVVDPVWPAGRNTWWYIAQSVNNGWMPLYPKGTIDAAGNKTNKMPKVLVIWAANYINQAKGWENLRSNLIPKIDLIVDINFRMDTSALYADVVLPAASYYEKYDLNSSDLHSFMHPFTPVIPPQWESKTDWQIWRELATGLQSYIDPATGLPFKYTDNFHGIPVTRDFATLLNDFDTRNTADPNYYPQGRNISQDRDACQFILDNALETQVETDPTKHMTILDPPDPHVPYDAANPNKTPGDLPDTNPNSLIIHPRRFFRTSEEWTSEILPDTAYYGFQRMFARNRPLNTLTGRQQFYIDHDWYLNECKEELPCYKPPVDMNIDPATGQPYPLRWVTPHGRWSIHSTWRDAKFQLRMQRGQPIVYLSPNEATKRGLVDNDRIEVFNSHGNFIAHLCISPRMPDGLAQMYHGWEKYLFPGTSSWQSPVTIRINPTQLAGDAGHGQLNFKLNYWGPTGSQKDSLVDIRKAL